MCSYSAILHSLNHVCDELSDWSSVWHLTQYWSRWDCFLVFLHTITGWWLVSAYLYFRAETEVEGAGKLSGQDKALLSAVWIPSLVYALMSRQVWWSCLEFCPCTDTQTDWHEGKYVKGCFLYFLDIYSKMVMMAGAQQGGGEGLQCSWANWLKGEYCDDFSFFISTTSYLDIMVSFVSLWRCSLLVASLPWET